VAGCNLPPIRPWLARDVRQTEGENARALVQTHFNPDPQTGAAPRKDNPSSSDDEVPATA
jgi:hypothetical protein